LELAKAFAACTKRCGIGLWRVKHVISSAVAAAILTGIALAQTQVQWLTDFKKAQEQAKSTNKLLLIQFTGSDWCPPCRMLQKEVLSTREFQEYSVKNLVLLEVDFPRTKQQPAELVKQNQMLAQRFAIEAFPTIIVLNAEGKKLGQMLGYDPRMGPQAFIDSLEKMHKG
jgi:thioredoxin-related protein